MKSKASSKFWKAYNGLPITIQSIAVKQYNLWLKNPRNPSLQFKKVQNFWSCRVTDSYRALAVMDGDTAIWFWIGSHAEYEFLLRRK
jgi:hypothetical protein